VRTELYDYDLPPGRIAQYPPRIRRKCRMLVLNRADGSIVHARFEELPHFLARGDLAVFNNTKVIPARLLGRKADTGGKVEVFLLRRVTGRTWEAMVRPGARCRPGMTVDIGGKGELRVAVGERLGEGKRIVELLCPGSVAAALAKHGHTPLPPYIDRADEKADTRDYQTVFARIPGAVASPTAGLHFDRVMLDWLARAGIRRAEITLHVGEGSFRPIRAATVEAHKLEHECFTVSRTAIRRLASAHRAGKRIIAVGTTVARALETVAAAHEAPVADWVDPAHAPRRTSGETDVFIAEPYRFRVIDALLTNFHLPRSSLLVLVSAFAGRERVLAAYAEAVKKNYRFYSYGDCMLML